MGRFCILSAQITTSGKDEVDMLGSGDDLVSPKRTLTLRFENRVGLNFFFRGVSSHVTPNWQPPDLHLALRICLELILSRLTLALLNSKSPLVLSKFITDRHLFWGGGLFPITDTESCCQKN